MPYIGIKRDNFEARCKAAELGRYLPKFEDLLRCAPYFKRSLKEDIKEFTRLSLTKFSAYYAEHHELEEMLARVGDTPNMVDMRRAVDLIESKLWRYPLNPFGESVRRRFRYYLATMRDIEQMRWVALECLNRVAGGWINAETYDYMKGALGWSMRIRYYDDVAYRNCSQNSIRVDGDTQLFYILTFIRSIDEKRS